MELGEVLTACDDPDLSDLVGEVEPPERNQSIESGAGGRPSVWRAAGSEDIVRAQQLEDLRPSRFSMVRRTSQTMAGPGNFSMSNRYWTARRSCFCI